VLLAAGADLEARDCDDRTPLLLGVQLPCIPTGKPEDGDDVVLGGGDPLATVKVCMCMYIDRYICICIYICMHVYLCVCVCVCVYVYTYEEGDDVVLGGGDPLATVKVCMCMYIDEYMCICIYICMYVYLCACVCMCVCIYI